MRAIWMLSLLLAVSASLFAQNGKSEIRTAEELSAIGASKDAMGGSYILMNDLTLENWVPLGGIDKEDPSGFTGTFDGNGHTITIHDFDTQLDNTRIGLFGLIEEGGTVKNLRVAGKADYTGGQKFLYIGGIAGVNHGKITCCVSSIDLVCNYVKAQENNKPKSLSGYESGRYGGCMVGVNFGYITHSYSDGSIRMNPSSQLFQGSAAGIAGCNGKPIMGSFGISVGPDGVGVAAAPGVMGKYTGGIAYCYSVASVSAPCACAIVAYNRPESSTFSNCVALNSLLEARGDTPKATPYTVAFAMAITHPNIQFHYRDDMVIHQYNAKGEEKATKVSDKCAVAFSTTQEESWWRKPDGLPEKEQQSVLGFPFGGDETTPWKWSETLKRPVLYWETTGI